MHLSIKSLVLAAAIAASPVFAGQDKHEFTFYQLGRALYQVVIHQTDSGIQELRFREGKEGYWKPLMVGEFVQLELHAPTMGYCAYLYRQGDEPFRVALVNPSGQFLPIPGTSNFRSDNRMVVLYNGAEDFLLVSTLENDEGQPETFLVRLATSEKIHIRLSYFSQIQNAQLNESYLRLGQLAFMLPNPKKLSSGGIEVILGPGGQIQTKNIPAPPTDTQNWGLKNLSDWRPLSPDQICPARILQQDEALLRN